MNVSRSSRFTRIAAVIALVSASCVAPPALAVQPGEILDDPKLEHRARELSAELRCLVCQNQSIDDSDAPLAHDLRMLVRERLKAGDSNDEVLEFIVSRYGEFVLLKPPFGLHTLLLWLGPLGVLFGAIWLARGAVLAQASRPSATGGSEKALSADEKARLKVLMENTDRS